MNIYEMDEPDERYLFLDWNEILGTESDDDGITIRLPADHPLLGNQE